MTDPVVTITDGQLRGIPYGRPPIGELRFKAPLPAEPWTGIRDATKEGPECPSKHMNFTYYVGSEDNCLNLNVYTRQLPTKQHSTTKPVMVWVHGGAFIAGSNKTEFFGPDYLMTEDIVLVTINYRLGIFGFLCLEDPSLEVPGNAGMKDMILALKWVQKNIRNFSGDPNNVTIFGQSAGGAAVHLLWLSPLSKGLFHKAIAQSGCALHPWVKGRCNGRETADNLGYRATSEKQILEYFRSLSARQLFKAQHKVIDRFQAGSQQPYRPVVEKPSNETSFLPDDPAEMVKSGSFNHVPLIMGYASNEGLIMELVKWINWEFKFVDDLEMEIDQNLNVAKGSEKSKEIAAKMRKFYYNNEGSLEENLDKFYMLKSDILFAHGIHRSIQNLKVKTDTPIYLYKMSLETSLNYFQMCSTTRIMPLLFIVHFLAFKLGKGTLKNMLLKLVKLVRGNNSMGATHADDLCYLFKWFFSGKLEPGSTEEISVRRFVKLWTNFAKTGNPTPDKDHLLDNIQWKPVTQEVNHYLEIGNDLKCGTNPDNDRMKFWDQFYE